MKFIFSGGGTMGSVNPLVAIYEEIKRRDPAAEFLWLATRRGPEARLISAYGMPVKRIFSGKLRRYFDIRNFIDPVFIIFGWLQALSIIGKFKPDYVVTAGGFVAVPVAWAAKRRQVPVLVHQQDVVPGLANRLMAKSAKLVTVSLSKSMSDFPGKKPVHTGNPIREEIMQGNKNDGYAYFKLEHFLPTVLVIGGGTGAAGLNRLVAGSIKDLVGYCQVIHLTGGRVKVEFDHPRYRQYDFLSDQMKNAYAIADLVVCRAGMQTLSELAGLGKPAIVIPMPGSHQEENAKEFFKHNAVALLDEKRIGPGEFASAISQLIADESQRQSLSHNIAKMMPADAAAAIVKLIYESR